MWLRNAVLPGGAAFNQVGEAIRLIREIKEQGEKALVFTSLKGLYGVLERAFKREWIGYTRMAAFRLRTATRSPASSRGAMTRYFWSGPGPSTAA
jgi:hypothetical protein